MKRLLVIGHVWPEPKTTAAGNRMLQLLKTFLDFGYHITFASAASKTEFSLDLGSLNIPEVSIRLNHSSFDVFVKELRPHVVLFDRFMVEEQFGWRIAENCPNTIRVLNTEDLHSLRDYREVCLKKGIDFTIREWLQTDKTLRELASIYRSDLTLLVSSFEKELLVGGTRMDVELLIHLPFMLDKISESTISQWPKFEERSDFICYGNGRHKPNINSFRVLKEEVWPLIRKELPKAKLHIYGAYLPQHIIEMDDPSHGFLVHGWIDDLEAKIRKSRVVMAPLRFGAGIKGKLTTAMKCGTPNVTTKIGAEGMSASFNWSGMVADNPNEFARACIELYTNREKWENAQKNGIEVVNSVYDSITLKKKLNVQLSYLNENLPEHRELNVVGAMLQHQNMAATKYMGKWIEEKNKMD